jgi:hypothetical protein
VIAFACVSTDEREFRAHAVPSIEAVSEGDSILMRRHRRPTVDPPIDRLFNEMIAGVVERDDLEALVLMHQGLTIEDRRFLATARGLLAGGDDIAVIGIGDEAGAREVEAICGDLIVLSAWACSELRFDPLLADSIDAAAVDLCLTARAGGKRVVAARLGAIRHVAVEDPTARRLRVRAGVALRRKWGPSSCRVTAGCLAC